MNGAEAYRLVCTYAALGGHRTGSPGDTATASWLSEVCDGLGAGTELIECGYSRFDGRTVVRLGDRLLDSLPLHYSAVGRRETRNVTVAAIDGHADEEHISAEIRAAAIDAAAHGRDALIVATHCPTEALCAVNRPDPATLGLPVVLVAGSERAALAEGPVHVSFEGAVTPDVSHNLAARFPGPAARRPIVVTTPMSGWFTCAGERGCGIAIALHLARLLSSHAPVALLLATGHELGFLGGHRLATDFAEEPSHVVHIGSCIANAGANLMSVCATEPDVAAQVAALLRPIGAALRIPERPADPACWMGESQCWAPRRRPMLSIAGYAPHFHTPGDLPEAATSPALLQQALDAVGSAAMAFALGAKG